MQSNIPPTDESFQRSAGIVRAYLKSLRDVPESTNAKNTLQNIEREYRVPISSLREFVAGSNSAVSAAIVTTWAKMMGADGDIEGIAIDTPYDAMPHQPDPQTQVPDRLFRLEMYDQIDGTRVEAANAFDAWADLALTGSVGEDGRHRDAFTPKIVGEKPMVRAQTLLDEIDLNIDSNLLPGGQFWSMLRDVAMRGEAFEQLALAQRTRDGTTGLWPVALVSMPPKTMWVRRGADGRVDPARAFVQKLSHQTEPIAEFPAWKIAHFANRKGRGELHGRSVLHSTLRSFLKMEAMEAGMIIRRLERAHQRMKHILDVGHLNDEASIIAAKAQYKQSTKKVRTIDGSRNFGTQRINMPADEDYLVAKRSKDSPADVVPVEGDARIGEIDDFIHFFNLWLSGLGPPKAHLGYEDNTQRSVITDLHIVFARKVRRFQVQIIEGLTHLYWVHIILAGWDPRKIPFSINPPSLGTRDELIRAQVQQAHATTIRFLSDAFGRSGKMPSIGWFLRSIMGLDETTIKQMELVDVVQTSKGAMGDVGTAAARKESAAMAAAALSNPAVQTEVARTAALLREQEIKQGIASPLKLVCPFGERFDDVVRMLRIKELKDITKEQQ